MSRRPETRRERMERRFVLHTFLPMFFTGWLLVGLIQGAPQ